VRDDLPDPLLTKLWLAPTVASSAPYIPMSIGTESLPVEYSQHRCLSADALYEYLDPEIMEQDATEYASQTCKRLKHGTCARPDEHLPDVTAAFEGFDVVSIAGWDEVLDEASDLVADGQDPSSVLSEYTNQRALEGLQLGNHLLDSVLTESRDNGGIHMPEVEVGEGTTASERSHPMILDGVAARDRVNCDVVGGWHDGNTIERAGDYGDPNDVPDYSATQLAGHPQLSEQQTTVSPWVWGIGGLILGAFITGLILVWRSKKAQ